MGDFDLNFGADFWKGRLTLSEKISRKNFLKACATVALTTPIFFTGDAQAAKSLRVRTRQGIYDGFIDKRGVKTWLGIPYAKPPIGNLRRHAPEPLEPSNKTFDAKKFGYSPMQAEDEIETASLLPQSENCLTLNIWTRGAKNNLPVMVFIPGGGFVGGGSGDPLYNGANFAANQNALIVTLNYRVNIFGFMNFASVDSAFSDSGYLGIKDQIAALEWIRENILNFGGDPSNVTIFGESAGATSVMLLMVAPSAQGLFQKAIAQSGHLSMYNTYEQSAEIAQSFMELSGCKNMQELEKKSSAELMLLYQKFCEENPYKEETAFFPTCDGKFLPAHPFKALKAGAARNIKFLTGTTAAEYCYWFLYYPDLVERLQEFHALLARDMYKDELIAPMPIYQAWRKNYAGDYLEFANQLDWRVGQELAAEYQSAFNDTFYYLFNQASPNELLGSCHAIDLPFVFGNGNKDLELNPEANLIRQMQEAWYMFAATGNPSNPLVPTWKKYSAADRQTMEINSASWTCKKDLNTDNLNALRGVYENNLLD